MNSGPFECKTWLGTSLRVVDGVCVCVGAGTDGACTAEKNNKKTTTVSFRLLCCVLRVP